MRFSRDADSTNRAKKARMDAGGIVWHDQPPQQSGGDPTCRAVDGAPCGERSTEETDGGKRGVWCSRS